MDKFNDWVFESLVSYGAIKDYSKTARSGKGKPPKGNLSIQIQRVAELRESKDPNDQMWGLIAYAGLQADGQIGKRFKSVVDEYCNRYSPPDPPAKLFKAISKAAIAARDEFKARFKETPKEVAAGTFE